MMKILVVDDSAVFRTQITSALSNIQGVEIVGSAANGNIALQKLKQLSVDLVTLDLEMPDMDGIETLKQIRLLKMNCKVIVFSSQTTKGAEKALEALREGADDIIAKPQLSMNDSKSPAEVIREMLAPKVMQFMHQDTKTLLNQGGSTLNATPLKSDSVSQKKYTKILNLQELNARVIVIASSTGGPNALEQLFSRIRKAKVPIVIAQHMPPVFTQILAKRLETVSKIPCAEAKQGESLLENHIYIAPGDFHLEIKGSPSAPHLHLHQGPQRNSVRPCADYLFETAAQVYGKHIVGVILTGMGEDGLQGARALKDVGAAVVIQDKESCVVFGMPGAVYQDGCYDSMGDLNHILLRLTPYLTIDSIQERTAI